MLGPAAFDAEARQARLAHLFDQGDPYTDAIFYVPGAIHLPALASRFVVDLNRHRDAAGPNGVIKLTDFDERPLYPQGYRLAPEAVEARLRRYWDPYHATLQGILQREAVRVFIDGHAMSPFGPALGPDRGCPRPALAIVTGGDPQGHPLDTHTSVDAATAQALVELLGKHFKHLTAEADGVPNDVWLNRPFTSGGIQERYSDPNEPHHRPGFVVEINRALYLDDVGKPIPGRIEALNAAFNRFLAAALRLF